jgi:hypothetical protein
MDAVWVGKPEIGNDYKVDFCFNYLYYSNI